MVKRTVAPTPTAAELDILAVLWEQGACTVREVHDVVGSRRAIRYTTILKQMQVMQGKGLLKREERSRSHVYSTTQSQAATQRALAARLLRHVFGGSLRSLLESALAAQPAPPEEIEEMRALLELARKTGR